MSVCETGHAAAAWRDLSRYRVLGWRAWDVYRALAETPQPVRLLAVVPAISRATLYRVLRRLEAHGLARRTCEGWCRGVAEPAAVALRLGLLFRRTHERRRVAREREAYRQRVRPRRLRTIVCKETPG